MNLKMKGLWTFLFLILIGCGSGNDITPPAGKPYASIENIVMDVEKGGTDYVGRHVRINALVSSEPFAFEGSRVYRITLDTEDSNVAFYVKDRETPTRLGRYPKGKRANLELFISRIEILHNLIESELVRGEVSIDMPTFTSEIASGGRNYESYIVNLKATVEPSIIDPIEQNRSDGIQLFTNDNNIRFYVKNDTYPRTNTALDEYGAGPPHDFKVFIIEIRSAGQSHIINSNIVLK